MSIVIHGESLSKRYAIGERERYLALRDVLSRAILAPARLFRPRPVAALSSAPNGNGNGHQPLVPGPRPLNPEHIWALKDVSFDVRRGEVVGIIGRNGAGKTTLLKILARVTKPTSGYADVRGRMGSLLEVGTGFHPELTGRENVYLSGAILGMSKAEIQRKFDEIVAFAEVAKFIDTPLKHYSTGMQMRLAFAVAAHLEPEILLVDEVLAVGDLSFQRKCLGKMGDVARAGRTILFVSHNLGAVARLCARTIWLDGGGVVADGAPAEVLPRYQGNQAQSSAMWTRPARAERGNEVMFLQVCVGEDGGMPRVVFDADEEVRITVRYHVAQSVQACQVGARVCCYDGTVVFTTTDADGTGYSALPKDAGYYSATFSISRGLLAPGAYHVLFAAHVPGRHVYDVIEQAVTFEIASVGSLASLDGRLGAVTPLFSWETVKEERSDHSVRAQCAKPSPTAVSC